MKFCEKPFKSVYLAPDGEVWPCGWMHCTLGNLYESSLDEIWHSGAAEQARESIRNGSFAFCRELSCPFCERGELLDLSEQEIAEYQPLDLPEDIVIANDRTCNIACTSCRKEVYCHPAEEREKIDGVLERLLPIANKAKSLDMNGQGEFLANSSFIRFLENLRPEREDFRINFETNGILFDEAHWERFAHLGDYYLSATITLNSLRREVFRYLSGGFDQLDKELQNIKFLSKLRREGKFNFLRITMVVQDCNFWEVPEYISAFSQSGEYEIDSIQMKPLFKWFKMDEETYWFKNILNPLHPYHKEYLKILADDCWNDPKVYDWGCHHIREAMPHPLKQEEVYRQIMMKIHTNKDGLSPQGYIKRCLDRLGAKRIGFYGKNEFSLMFSRMLQDAGAEVFQLTWVPEDCDGEFPKVAKQEFKPDMADAMIIIDFFKGGYWFEDLRSLGYEKAIVTVEEFIEE